ncbi:MAG: homoserine dehydrogenase [Pseudomonadota bacterium]
MKGVRIGIAGLGTVGTGVWNILHRNTDLIQARLGFPVEITAVALRRPRPDLDLSKVKVHSDVMQLACDENIDIFVELIGGYKDAAAAIRAAIAAGKHVVTANKALLAEQGESLLKEADEKGCLIAFEAAVAGGIPVIKALREGLCANSVSSVAGIINGTANYILSAMSESQQSFEVALLDAQKLGYAEADPTFDIQSIDAAHKITILAALAFGIPLNFNAVKTQGITHITPLDLVNAEHLGYRIKQLALARRDANGKVDIRVHPAMIPKTAMLASVHGAMNAVMIIGDAVGPTLFYGAGAGSEPTGSAVIADIMEIARHTHHESSNAAVHPLAFSVERIPAQYLTADDRQQSAYLRFTVADSTGVLAFIAQQLSQQGVGIERLVQTPIEMEENSNGPQFMSIVVITHPAPEKALHAALTALELSSAVKAPIQVIPIEARVC